MADSTMAPPLVDASTVSIARLHGEACWHCGAVTASLVSAGDVSTAIEGGIRMWPVTVCRDHRGKPLKGLTGAIMQSTRIPTADGSDRPRYIVHAPGEVPPLLVPRCNAGCWCRS